MSTGTRGRPKTTEEGVLLHDYYIFMVHPTVILNFRDEAFNTNAIIQLVVVVLLL